MKRSGANEDTSSLPVISALDAELTYLQRPPLCGTRKTAPVREIRRPAMPYQFYMNMSGVAISACELELVDSFPQAAKHSMAA